MFEDSLFATNPRRNPQRGWSAVMSFALQAALVILLIAVPLFYTEALPMDYVRSFVEMPAPPPGRPPAPPHDASAHHASPSNLEGEHVLEIHEIPKGPPKRIVDEVGPSHWGPGVYVVGSTGGTDSDNPITGVLGGTGRDAPVPQPPAPTKPVPISHISEGLLIHKVMPAYPEIARMAHQQGTVVLHAIIGRDGTIQQLQAVSGPPLLLHAAIEAVQQ
ncbi:MAG: energy transducer TonB, partial [Terriglobales bacterium]